MKTLLLMSLLTTGAAAQESIDEVLRSAVASHRIPGVVAMAAKEGKIVYQGAYGNRIASPPAPIAVNTIFRIASMAKPITTVALLQLVEAGKVDLDAPAANYVPAIRRSRMLGAATPPLRPVTVRHLLTHTSGFGYSLWDKQLSAFRAKNPLPSPEPLLFEPGSRWQYGTSTDWLGRIVEAVSGQNLEQYFRARILDPLGMVDTSFNIPAGKLPRLVSEYRRAPDGSLKEEPIRAPQQVKTFGGGGGIYSTAADYTRFMNMILGGGQLDGVRILNADSVALMQNNQIGDLTLSDFRSQSRSQSLDGSVPGGLDRFTFGFALNTRPVEGGRAAGSLAWAGIENTYFWIDPANRTAAIILMQLLPFLDRPALETLNRFEKAVYRAR
jgi:CubicO group peptidase (beta-lactamase class C family)